jgi:hypothetical protein
MKITSALNMAILMANTLQMVCESWKTTITMQRVKVLDGITISYSSNIELSIKHFFFLLYQMS